MMNCDRAFDRYLALDKNERVPLGVTLHLLVCPSCRTAVRRLTKAELFLAAPFAVSAAVLPRSFGSAQDDRVVLDVMERIRAAGFVYPEFDADEGRVSLRRWMVSGIILAVGFALVPSSSIGIWSDLQFGTSFSIPFYLLCGVANTIWCGLFIGSNIDFFVKKFGVGSQAKTI